jgi:uncharacterized repeat protein (TIGR03803 family)
MRTLRLLALTIALGASLPVPNGAAQAPPSFNTLYSFTRQNGDGGAPYAGVVAGTNGALYGTTVGGGLATSACATYSSLFYNDDYCGTVFELTPPAIPGGVWVETILHSFTGQNGDGFWPSGVVLGKDGALYGTTVFGGSGPCASTFAPACGTVFQLAPPATPGGVWTETVLHSFTGQGGDGAHPFPPANNYAGEASLAVGDDGALYGTTQHGGAAGYGAVFRMTPPAAPGEVWTETVLYSFASGAGAPAAGLAIGNDGVLYGTTSSENGTVFKLNPPTAPGGAWTYLMLHSFDDRVDGARDGISPQGTLVIGDSGTLYGATYLGGKGDCNPQGCGTVFAVTPPAAPGGAWTETVVINFGVQFVGLYPGTGLVMGQHGVLYGTTLDGAFASSGAAFALKPPTTPGGTWSVIGLSNFTSSPAGVFPTGLIIGNDGVLFGTTAMGGSSNAGEVFQLTP